MYSIKKNVLFVNLKQVKFNFNIRDAIEYMDRIIVLLDIPYANNDINNIYCIDKSGAIVWQSEDLNSLYPNLKNLPYEQMGIKDDILYAVDFYGRSYSINLNTGTIEDCHIVK